jgi:alpha-methylacyl-CoA racemase
MFAAQRSGRGRRVDVSMCEGSLGFALPVLGDLAASGKGPHRGGDMLTGGSAAYGVYRTADDQFLSVAPLEPKFWDAFCKTIGRAGDASELVAGPAVHEKLRAEIAAILVTKTRAEWEQIFASVDACVEPVLSPLEASQHAVHTQRDVFVEIDGTRYPRTALARLGQRSSHSAPPRQGQHTDSVLAERGFTADEIASLRAAGAAR